MKQFKPRKILFACVPADGHFNPLTGIAWYLRSIGHDVRWYASKSYTAKLQKLGIPQYLFTKAVDVNGSELDERYPERKAINNPIKKLNWDIINFFVMRGPEYLQDIKDINEEFPFDVLICDNTFTGASLVQKVLDKPVIGIGVVPFGEGSKDLPPSGLGMTPSYGFWGRRKQDILRWLVTKVLMAKPDKVMKDIMTAHGVDHKDMFIFDMMSRMADLYLQNGCPGFEYQRSDLGSNIRFIGALLPHSDQRNDKPWYDERVKKYKKVVLLTQGTVERDINKILIPALEAFKDSDTLLICATGFSQTEELRKRYPYDNIIIEDFIPFHEVMPYATVYLSNGGFGGVMLGIEHKLPMVVAGVHEGKNEICARVGYHKYGINLKTETPTSDQLKKAVEKVSTDPVYKENISRLGAELTTYDPNALSAQYIEEVLESRMK